MSENTIKREEIPVLKPELESLVHVLKFERKEDICLVFLSLNCFDKWKKLGFETDHSEHKMSTENSIYILFNKMSQSDINICVENWKKETEWDLTWFELLPPFKKGEIENTLQIVSDGNNAFKSLKFDSKFIPSEKNFIHETIEMICLDPLLKKIFD